MNSETCFENPREVIVKVSKDTITCDVCHSEFYPLRKGTIRISTDIFTKVPIYKDYMDCPVCGCQILLKDRYFAGEIKEETK